jgi:four helix bundle protein
MTREEFKKRTKEYAICVARFCKSLPYDFVTRSYVDQLVRSTSSVAANYRSACRGKSTADFVNKLRIVEEEADESLFFIEMIAEFFPQKRKELRNIYREGNEILSMIVASIKTTNRNKSVSGKKSEIANPKSKI